MHQNDLVSLAQFLNENEKKNRENSSTLPSTPNYKRFHYILKHCDKNSGTTKL